MKKTVSFLLALALVVTLLAPSALALQAYAADGEEENKGLQINKTATYNEDTKDFTITLEAYATGEKVTSTVHKDVPTDIVLVLDQSGSMKNNIGSVSFDKYTGTNRRNSNLHSKRHNGGEANLWYRLSDGSYVSVSVTKTQSYNQLSSRGNSSYYDNANNLYEKVGDEYKTVILRREYDRDTRQYEYTYTFSDGTTITSYGRNTTPDFGTHGPLYTPAADGDSTVYTYTYTDSTGTHVIGTGTGASNNFTAADLYYRTVNANGGGTKLNALKSAVNTFIGQVSEKAKGTDKVAGTADDVSHRIAVVGFASTSSSYTNTELLSTANAVNYGNAGANNYKDALVNVNGTNGNINTRLTTAVDRLDASGDTYLEYGMDMANKIFEQYPVNSNERQRVVVVFTDGYPAPYGTDDFKYSMADNAIANAKTTKSTYNATVYTVGVFSTADPTADITTNFATSDGWSNYNYGSNNLTDLQEATAANRYLHYVSSNYLTASSLNNGGSLNPKASPFNGGDSYYLSASDADTLNNIFQQIADQVQTGGSSTTLDEETVIKDIIAPQFQLPAGATANNITLESYSCTGKDSSGKCTFSPNKNATAMGATAKINADGTVDVTGFDFAANWCGTETIDGEETPRGSKVVIKFTVQTKDGFLGGNDVYTNTSAGVYENANATEPVLTFPRPQVNVPINDVTVTAGDKNVYLLGDLTAEQIKAGATAKCGNVELNLAAENYGLESWQYEYVTITTTYTDASGNTITNLNDLKDDTTYTVAVTVAPKTTTSTSTEGTVATAKTNSATGNINVFKPTLTFKDSTVYYGDTAPTSYDGNLTKTEWKHDGTLDTAVTMTGDKPDLSLTYTPGAGIDTAGKVATKNDIPVDVTVKIGTTDVTSHTDFVHTECQDRTETLPQGKEFLLHVKTCTLTITKAAGTNTTIGTDEYFVFNIKKDGAAYTQVTIQGIGSVTISELPVGTYTVEEDTATAWRYTPSMSENSATLSKTNTSATVTCTNTTSNDKWLNHFARVINTFSDKNN